ncbi:CDP-alcohol phosphatidyltransferase family protein [Azotobacter chroococcum]|jgi:CDP-diacylglycerol--glycerol-3-phosphate 3-phosphatidyltransferase|uniref:CDP-diacylglycerol--glycerol-3-phosphate 3-phosphatidyltransferase n=1 Tax=Azotobacter chroococcum TaxID=353 RepID=A0A4R1NZK0_9GAMM|nr:CDP-alcohol phosphatidyltransferase family protein [Azotobacter chroococcum]TBV94252.1 CDP-alcohol phosphatidyltransferase family protein [Azotobacter chroococcum]TCL18881.1 CDP-diacylglycerol--glycerol-3-phosphate 3-phosphatidyltransferase [Azotobacter chroococcum]
MPSIYQLKPRFQNLLRPRVQRLHGRGVTANQVTLAAAGVSVLPGALVAAFAAHAWLFALIPLWMFLRMALNAIDGMLAREFGQQSVLGAYLNELCDVIADSALFLPFALLPGITPLGVIVEYAGAMGPLVGAGVATGLLPSAWLDGLLLIGALLLWTLANRVRQGIAEAARQPPSA